jgi:hypothetical protein
MDINITAICVTIIIGVIAIALSIHFGLRSFTNNISKQIDDTRESIVLELSGIKENIIRIITKVEDVWELATVFAGGRTVGTVEVELKNFGKTKVSAELASKETRYLIHTEKGKLMGDAIGKISRSSGLSKTELEMFGKEPTSMTVGNTLRITIPSVDPELCTKYMNIFLRWLDTEYASGIEDEVDKFERDIKV